MLQSDFAQLSWTLTGPQRARVGTDTPDAQQHPAHLLGIRSGPVQEQGVEHILAPEEEPVAVLVQVEAAEAQGAAVAKEQHGAVGA